MLNRIAMGVLYSTGSLTSTTTFVVASVGPSMLLRISGSNFGDDVIIQVHDCAATGDVAAGNLKLEFTLSSQEGIYQLDFDEVMFGTGITVKATLGASGPTAILVEWE
jgi:hypothetical protein